MLKRISLVVMASFYILAGVNHFAHPDFYMPMMPPYVPWHRSMVYLSGLAEVLLGIGVLVPRTRQMAAWGLIALLIAILPANLHVALNDVPLFGAEKGLGMWNWVRLPFQAVLIAWAWWHTRPDG